MHVCIYNIDVYIQGVTYVILAHYGVHFGTILEGMVGSQDTQNLVFRLIGVAIYIFLKNKTRYTNQFLLIGQHFPLYFRCPNKGFSRQSTQSSENAGKCGTKKSGVLPYILGITTHDFVGKVAFCGSDLLIITR